VVIVDIAIFPALARESAKKYLKSGAAQIYNKRGLCAAQFFLLPGDGLDRQIGERLLSEIAYWIGLVSNL